jgi:hypothetical protein
VLTIPGSVEVDATSPAGRTVEYVASATDDRDLGPVVRCDAPSGSVFPIGTTTVNCTATDSSGNSVVSTFHVNVRGAAEQLRGLLTELQPVGPGTSLADKVAHAEAAYSAGNLAGACEILRSLVNQLRAQSGKQIPADRASSFIADATRIRAVLGC